MPRSSLPEKLSNRNRSCIEMVRCGGEESRTRRERVVGGHREDGADDQQPGAADQHAHPAASADSIVCEGVRRSVEAPANHRRGFAREHPEKQRGRTDDRAVAAGGERSGGAEIQCEGALREPRHEGAAPMLARMFDKRRRGYQTVGYTIRDEDAPRMPL